MKHHPSRSQHKRFDKDSRSELKILYDFLSTRCLTARQCSEILKIRLPNLTRYKRDLECAGRLWVVKIGICPRSKEPGVQFISTNPELIPKPAPTLFDL